MCLSGKGASQLQQLKFSSHGHRKECSACPIRIPSKVNCLRKPGRLFILTFPSHLPLKKYEATQISEAPRKEPGSSREALHEEDSLGFE